MPCWSAGSSSGFGWQCSDVCNLIFFKSLYIVTNLQTKGKKKYSQVSHTITKGILRSKGTVQRGELRKFMIEAS